MSAAEQHQDDLKSALDETLIQPMDVPFAPEDTLGSPRSDLLSAQSKDDRNQNDVTQL